MASNFNLVLDTTAPGGSALSLNGNASYTSTRDITAAVSTTDTPTTGYQIKVWGDVDISYNASIQTTEGASAWITPGAFPANQAVRLSTGDGSKTINVKIRDDVWNESATLTKSITLDTSAPTVNITTAPDVTKVSTVSGKRTVTFGWQANETFTDYEVAVVSSSGASRGSGTVIGSTNGSTNTSGSAGSYPADTTITTTIDARDLQAASSGDGVKIVKVFVKDTSGLWNSL